MKHTSFLWLCMFVQQGHAQITNQQLYQIYQNDRIGFINATGKVIIEPRFRSADDFSEGLAPARENGRYGFIDATGQFVIQPQFDYAGSFHEGFAIVHVDGKPCIINKSGSTPFELNFREVGRFENGMAMVRTATKKLGFINRQGKLVIDTVFERISPFVDGVASVYGVDHQTYKDKEKGIKINFQAGLIDTTGKFIVPYGTYSEIREMTEGYFGVKLIPAKGKKTSDESGKSGFIDKTGKLVFVYEEVNHTWLNGEMHCGLAKINLYNKSAFEKNSGNYSTENSYEGYINLKGEIIVNNSDYEYANDFAYNRAFVRTKDDDYFLINTRGALVSQEPFEKIIGGTFSNDVAFVEKDGMFGMIDTNGKFLIEPRFEGIDEVGLVNDYFFFSEEVDDSKSEYDQLYGVAKKDGSFIFPATMEGFNRNGFQGDLLVCQIDGKLTYINKKGEIVWQESLDRNSDLTKLNIDFMNRGYFYAYGKPTGHEYGGYGVSKNIPEKISDGEEFSKGKLNIIVKQEIRDTIFREFVGITVYVANLSGSVMKFEAQDSRLYMKVQALDPKGIWRDIEYLPSSWCGNSYHTLTLDDGYSWKFLTPLYEGDFKTKLRIELKHIDQSDTSKEFESKKIVTVYSNEYDASINPGQFWRKREYSPAGLMDPYND